MKLITVAVEFLTQYIQDNAEYIENIDDVLENPEFYNDFLAYLENPSNGYRHLIFHNDKAVKSAYVRYCNKMVNKYEMDEYVKYNVNKNELLKKMIQLIALESFEIILESI
jgi:hypothetical protein